MRKTGISLELSHHITTAGIAYQQITIELVSRDRIITPSALFGLPLPSGIDPSKGVIISGRAPVWLYAYLIHECHPTLWVACFDPRLGAVVTSTHTTQLAIGSLIPLEALNLPIPNIQPVQAHNESGPGLLIVGPPDSGKSVLSHQLFSTMIKDYPNIYLQRAQWDGEGNWILELSETATKLEREAFKQHNKGGLTERFFPYQEQAILNLRHQKSLVIVDAGGMVQPEKKSILDACTHYLIISSKREEIEPWHQFCKREGGLQPVAVVHSVLEERLEVLKREPFLEIVCGPWITGETQGIPKVLRETMNTMLEKEQPLTRPIRAIT